MTLRYGLKEAVIKKITDILSLYPQVEKAVLYGSRAMGRHRNGSDIDLTLCGGEDLTLGVLYGIMGRIDDLLLPYKIDLSIFGNINDPEVIEHIRRVGVVFYRRRRSHSQLPSAKNCSI
ncbi:MAG: nucleotidyltransferase domain-containing protein [Syntrophaceae bacterium]|nr:nucleotidyltransferase domain-containing protein [Syntrophaceae bacterium]